MLLITPATSEKSEVQKSTSSALHASAGQCGYDGVCIQNVTARQSTYSHPCPMPPDMHTKKATDCNFKKEPTTPHEPILTTEKNTEPVGCPELRDT